ncbi:MAG: O-antigen ligase family protein, partial [Thermoflexales bacterium]|nr:O-antigen ligase family protein [Thermoflexales bacterium]
MRIDQATTAARFRRARLFSAASICLVLISGAALFAVRQAQAFEQRGKPAHGTVPLPVFGAEQLRLGVSAALEQYDPATLDARLAALAKAGVRYVRQEFRWDEIEPRRGYFDWSTSDRIVDTAQRHGIQLLAVLWTTPPWARQPSGNLEAPPIATAPPADVDDFARFAGAFAARYDATGAILAYQIWDEPNLSAAWGNGLINPTYYLQLLRAARRAIHAVNPNALIVLAALAPTVEQSNVNLAPQLFLLKLYQLGGHQAFDVVAAKPYGFSFPPDDRRVDAQVLNFSHVILLREMMVAHNEGHKAIWATQFGWNALPTGWQGEPSIWGQVSEEQQAEFLLRAVQRAATEWHWMGAMFIENLQPRPRATEPKRDARWGFALLSSDGTPRLAYRQLSQLVAAAEAAPRPQLFAACRSPQSLYRALNLDNVITAMPEVLASKPDCQAPNPRASFSEGWRFDQLGADTPDRPDARVVFRFHGDALALIVRRGNYRAYTFVSVDGKPANRLPQEARGAYLVMTSPGLYPVIEAIRVADGLGAGEHTAELHVDRGWNQWALIGWSPLPREDAPPWAVIQFVLIAALVMGLGAAVWSVPRARWGEVAHAIAAHVRNAAAWRVFSTGAGFSALAWGASAIAWAQHAATAYQNLNLGAQVVLPALASALVVWAPAMLISVVALTVLLALIALRLEVGLLLLAFFVPFYLVPQRLFERAFAMVELLVLWCAVVWGMQLARRVWQDWRAGALRLSWRALTLFDWSVVALVVVSALSTTQAAFRVEALRELRLVIIEPAVAYAVLRTGAWLHPDRSKHMRDAALSGFVLGAAAIALIGLFNYARGETFAAEFGLPRIKSVFGSPNNDALFLERALPFAMSAALFGVGWRRWLSGLAAGAIALAIVLSLSRGALLLGVPLMAASMALTIGGRWRWLGAVVIAGMILGVIVLTSGALTPWLAETRFARLATAFDVQRSTGFFRLNVWQSALTMWRDHFWLGVGPDNFLYAYRSFYILPVAWQEPNLSHPHNVVLDFAARLGVFGLLAGAGLVVGYLCLIHAVREHDRLLAVGCAGLLGAMLGHGLVDHAFFLVELAYAFMLTAAAM